MKNKVLLLSRTLLINQFKLNTFQSKGEIRNKRRFYLMLAVGIFLCLMLMVYAYMMGMSLAMMGMIEIIPAYGLIMASAFILFFTILKSNGTLFAFKDYEIMMSLPLTTRTIIFSRFLLMYGLNSLMVLLVMLPMGIAYIQYSSVTLLFYPIWVVGMLVAPLFPTTIAATIGAIIVWIASKFRYSNALSTVLSLVLLVGILVLSFVGGGLDESAWTTQNMANLGATIGDMINKSYPLARYYTEAVVNSSLVSLGIFVGTSVLWYGVFILVLARQYKQINTALMTHQTHSNYQLTQLHNASPLKALYKKELKRFLSSTVYVLNVSVGVIMAIVLSVAAFFVSDDMIISMFPMDNAYQMLESMLPFVVCGMVGMSCTAAVSLSLEGKNIWILQSLPIHPMTIFQSKMLVNLSIILPTAFISSLLLSIRFASNFISALYIISIPLIYCLFIPVWGMFIDINMHHYDWVSETAIVKQSANALVGLLGSGLIGLSPAIVILFMSTLNIEIFMPIVVVIFLMLTGILYKKIAKASQKHLV